jgi:hypothetical protein
LLQVHKEAALKQMNSIYLSALYLLHNNMNHVPFTSVCVFCWPHQPELTAAFLLRAACACACVLRAGRPHFGATGEGGTGAAAADHAGASGATGFGAA